MSDTLIKPVITRKKNPTQADLDAARKVEGRDVVEVGDLAAFDVNGDLEGEIISGTVHADVELVTIDQKIGKGEKERDGRILIFSSVIRTEKGKKYQFSMSSEAFLTTKKGDKINVQAEKNVNNDRCRLKLI